MRQECAGGSRVWVPATHVSVKSYCPLQGMWYVAVKIPTQVHYMGYVLGNFIHISQKCSLWGRKVDWTILKCRLSYELPQVEPVVFFKGHTNFAPLISASGCHI
jgi:hypothetical protein